MGLHFPLLSFTLLDSLHFTGTLWAVLRVLPCLVIHYWWRPVPGPPPLSGPNGGRLLAPTGPLAGFIYITSPLRCGTVGSAKWTKLTLPYLATTGSYHRFQWRTKAPVGRKRERKREREQQSETNDHPLLIVAGSAHSARYWFGLLICAKQARASWMCLTTSTAVKGNWMAL